jgi:hypothetical protein
MLLQAFAVAAVCNAALPTPALAEQVPVAAVKVNKGDKFELVLDDKAAGRMVYYFSFHAVNKGIKGGDWVEGRKNVGAGWGDLTQGRGHVHGFDVNGEGADVWKAGWAGECYPVNGSDGKPVPHCAGGWSVVPGSGTGKFAGVSGGGTWKGHALPSGDFEVTWDGVLEK